MPLININLLLVPSRDELKSTQLQAANAAVPEATTCTAEDQTFDEVHIHHLKINQYNEASTNLVTQLTSKLTEPL